MPQNIQGEAEHTRYQMARSKGLFDMGLLAEVCGGRFVIRVHDPFIEVIEPHGRSMYLR